VPFLSPSQQCINTEGSRALTAIGETFLIHYWTREERLASPSMKAVLFQYPCGNRYHFSTLINCFIDYCFVLYILLFESVENIAFAVKAAVKFMMADVCLCSWGPADCRHYRQWQWGSDAVSPGTGLRSVPGAAFVCVVSDWARLGWFPAWQTRQLARQQDGTVSAPDHSGWPCVLRCVISTICPVEFLTELHSMSLRYGDGAGNTVEENSSVFCLIQMR